MNWILALLRKARKSFTTENMEFFMAFSVDSVRSVVKLFRGASGLSGLGSEKISLTNCIYFHKIDI